MKKALFKISVLLLSISAVISYGQPSLNKINDKTMIVNSPAVVTITYVKKPWYAFRFLAVNKFKESMPEYKAIAGLLQKNYHLAEDYNLFGGIYYWRSKADVRAWFTPKWFERVLKTYGKEGVVKYYSIQFQMMQ